MKKRFFLGVLFCFSSFGFCSDVSTSLPQSREEFCRFSKEPKYFIGLSHNAADHLALWNRGGLLNEGVCWWHSLFQRAAFYLTVFRPELPKPNHIQAIGIIDSLARRNQVVEIPGYTNFYEFSKDWTPDIQRKLEQWQIYDGFILQKWIGSVIRTPKIAPHELHNIMDELFVEVVYKHRVSWVMAKRTGINAHAWLVIDMRRTRSGMELDVLDSNSPGKIDTITYNEGSDSIFARNYDSVVPYLGRTHDFQKFALARKAYCGP